MLYGKGIKEGAGKINTAGDIKHAALTVAEQARIHLGPKVQTGPWLHPRLRQPLRKHAIHPRPPSTGN